MGTKKGTGSSGVPLRYHTKAEYDLLNKHQKSKLQDGSSAGELGKDGNSSRKDIQPKKAKYDNKKVIASAVGKKVAEKMKEIE